MSRRIAEPSQFGRPISRRVVALSSQRTRFTPATHKDAAVQERIEQLAVLGRERCCRLRIQQTDALALEQRLGGLGRACARRGQVGLEDFARRVREVAEDGVADLQADMTVLQRYPEPSATAHDDWPRARYAGAPGRYRLRGTVVALEMLHDVAGPSHRNAWAQRDAQRSRAVDESDRSNRVVGVSTASRELSSLAEA